MKALLSDAATLQSYAMHAVPCCSSNGFCKVSNAPLIDFQPPCTAVMSSRAILDDIKVRRPTLLDFNGHACLVLHNVLALDCDDLGVPEDRVRRASCHLNSKLVLPLPSDVMVQVVLSWLFFCYICRPES